MTVWHTRQGRNLRNQYRDACHNAQAPCWLCNQPINYDLPPQTPWAFETDHYWPQVHRPDLVLDWDNLRPSHVTCNRSRRHKPPPGPRPPLGATATTW